MAGLLITVINLIMRMKRSYILDSVREVIRRNHFSFRNEKAFVRWIYTHVLNRNKYNFQSPQDTWHSKSLQEQLSMTMASSCRVNYNCLLFQKSDLPGTTKIIHGKTGSQIIGIVCLDLFQGFF